MIKKVFVNLPVENIERSMAFFTKMEFEFDRRFTDENAACVIINDTFYVMLLTKKQFMSFTNKEINDTNVSSEAIISLNVKKTDQIEELLDKAMQAGASHLKRYDYGWMSGGSFLDLDGHMWEIFHMDEANMPVKQDSEIVEPVPAPYDILSSF